MQHQLTKKQIIAKKQGKYFQFQKNSGNFAS